MIHQEVNLTPLLTPLLLAPTYRALALEALSDDDVLAIRVYLDRQRDPGSDVFGPRWRRGLDVLQAFASLVDGHAGSELGPALPLRKITGSQIRNHP